jgi:zeta-carotene desaturase
MPTVLIAGGGLAGLSAAAALAGAGFEVDLYEARPFLGGRATSYPVVPADPDSPTIDNCQHILLGCCVNLLDFYSRLGVRDLIRFHREFYFIEPGGRVSVFGRGRLAAFLGLKFLGARDKLGIANALMALRRERGRRTDLDRITMLDWLREKRQTGRAIGRLWRPVLVSAVNEELDRMAARHGFQVFWLGFLARAGAGDMGVPAVPLARLYDASAFTGARLHLRTPVERIDAGGFTVAGEVRTADFLVCALPFERLESVGLAAPPLEHSPITGIHLWFDREVMQLPHATLLDGPLHWVFRKDSGRYLQFVVSASRELAGMSGGAIIDMAIGQVRRYFPAARDACLERSHVVKELRATFSAAPGVDALRPGPATAIPRLFLAGDWTATGWPATMEGAVRSGYIAAEAVCAAAGAPRRFLLPDVA